MSVDYPPPRPEYEPVQHPQEFWTVTHALADIGLLSADAVNVAYEQAVVDWAAAEEQRSAEHEAAYQQAALDAWNALSIDEKLDWAAGHDLHTLVVDVYDERTGKKVRVDVYDVKTRTKRGE